VIGGRASTSLCVDGVPRARSGADGPYGLRGISSVWVLIESLGPEEANIGLADDAVRTDVELRLKGAGLRVISPKEAKKIATTGNTFLYVNVAVTSVDGRRPYSRNSRRLPTCSGIPCRWAQRSLGLSSPARDGSQMLGDFAAADRRGFANNSAGTVVPSIVDVLMPQLTRRTVLRYSSTCCKHLGRNR